MTASPSIKPQKPSPEVESATTSSSHPTCLYGDSTPFPHEGNFIETIRHAVDCGVALLAAQNTIERAVARVGEVDRAKHIERSRLEAMGTLLKRALTPEMTPNAERLVRAGSRILEASRAAIDAEVAALETAAGVETTRARTSADQGHGVAQRALETFLLHHDLPGTEVGLRFIAEEERYAARAHVETPFGVEATFELQIPLAHEWGRHIRVGDLNAGTEVHVPAESGLFFKKVAVQPVKLDRMFVTGVHVGPSSGALCLRRQPTNGSGYKIDFDTSKESTRVLLTHLGEDGMETPEAAKELSGDDAVHLLRLWQRVLDSTEELGRRRHVMTGAAFDGHPIMSFDEPNRIAERLIRLLSPIVREIAQRAGAPGELVLRRDVRAGRREEIYITKAELQEKVLTLPPLLRGVFDAFDLDSPRSPRAPAPSAPSYEDIDEEALEVSNSSVVEIATA